MNRPVHYRPRSKWGSIAGVGGVYCCGRDGGISARGRMPNNDCLTTDVERVTCRACLRAMQDVIDAKIYWLDQCEKEVTT